MRIVPKEMAARIASGAATLTSAKGMGGVSSGALEPRSAVRWAARRRIA